MALYAFDGTWNEAKSGEDVRYENTNVARFFKAYNANTAAAFRRGEAREVKNLYVAGVGTRYDLLGKAFGGLFGLGELPRIQEAYEHLCESWAEGDRTIDIVGFSRGAATTLDFCHYIQERGIRSPGREDVVEPSPRINFLGVWDVVAAFGLANTGSDILNIGHHLSLPRTNLNYCFHAIALDESRLSFLPTRLPGACEVWFRGAHSDVGGGNGNRGLNDITLAWMFRKAKAAGLPITDADVAALTPAVVEPQPASKSRSQLRTVGATDRRHYTVSAMDGWTTPPDTCAVETADAEATATEIGAKGLELLPTDVRRRMAALWEAADEVARREGYTLDHVREWLLTLIEGRSALVTNEAELTVARANMGRLITLATTNASRRDFRVLQDFFLNEALLAMPHLFPFTD